MNIVKKARIQITCLGLFFGVCCWVMVASLFAAATGRMSAAQMETDLVHLILPFMAAGGILGLYLSGRFIRWALRKHVERWASAIQNHSALAEEERVRHETRIREELTLLPARQADRLAEYQKELASAQERLASLK